MSSVASSTLSEPVDVEKQPTTASQPGNTNEQTESSRPKSYGYRRLASFMAESGQYAIFRRFGELNCLNLLFLQAELVSLEEKLKEAAAADGSTTENLRDLYDKNRVTMARARDKDGKYVKQWELALDIREVLEEYNKQTLILSQLARLPRPRGQDIGFLNEWMEEPDKGAVYLNGKDADCWKVMEQSELHAVHARSYDDFITMALTGRAIHIYHKFIGKHYKKPQPGSLSMTAAYSHGHVLKLVAVLTMVLQTIFPLASILILNAVHDKTKRIFIICGLTSLFAAVVAAFKPAKRVETFAATMAFAAVEVVFISK